MATLKSIILDSDTKEGRIFDLFIQVLIIVSLVAFSIETLPGMSDETYNILNNVEIFVIVVFTTEYTLRIFLSDRKLAYIFSFYGVIDLLAILPFYLSNSVSLQTLRALRLLRLLRIFKLARYHKAMDRIGKAMLMAKDELVIFTVVTVILLYLSAVGIYHFEHAAQPEVFKSIFDSLWWSVATLTTVGYGDVYPITAGGRIFTFLILMLGLGVVAVPTGIIASALAAVRKSDN